MAWTLVWAASLARFGPGVWGDSQPVATWAAVLANLVVGVGWIVAFTRFLRALDELQRKILQDALAVALGAGWVVGFGYVVADAGGLIPVEVEIAVLPTLMGRRLPDRLRHREDQIPMRNRIADLRSEHAWTQADVAQRVGVSRQTINAIETGKFDPILPVAFCLARLFELKVEEVFLDEQ